MSLRGTGRADGVEELECGQGGGTRRGRAGREIFFFSDSHLTTKYFKVVTNAKKVGRHF